MHFNADDFSYLGAALPLLLILQILQILSKF